MNDVDLQVPQLYFNRELSFLEFNQRVLEQAKDARIPLLERVKFLCISCTNLDEFFEIRVAGLKELLEAGAVQTGPDGLSVHEQLKAIRARATRLVGRAVQAAERRAHAGAGAATAWCSSSRKPGPTRKPHGLPTISAAKSSRC